MIREPKVPLRTPGFNLMLLSDLIKFYRSIITLNILRDLPWLSQQKTLLKVSIQPFFQKCILNADAAFMDFAVETKCLNFSFSNSISQNFDPGKSSCLTFISKKFKKANQTDAFLGPFGILCQSLSGFEQIFLEIWQREDPEKTAFLKAPRFKAPRFKAPRFKAPHRP